MLLAHLRNSPFVKKLGPKQSFLCEIRAQTFFTLTYGVAAAYSTNDNPSREKLSDWIEWSGEVISLGLFDYKSS